MQVGRHQARLMWDSAASQVQGGALAARFSLPRSTARETRRLFVDQQPQNDFFPCYNPKFLACGTKVIFKVWFSLF